MKLALLAALLSGCVIDVSIEGKQCPCSEGYVCDVLRNTCSRSACEPALSVVDFSPQWATAHDIRWTWQTQGPEERFLRYELRVAESTDDLASLSNTARIFDTEINPELGVYRVPGTGDAVTATTTRSLDAGATYHAQLLVVDVDQCAFASPPVARATRPEPTGTIEIFGDELPPNSQVYPGVVMLVNDGDGAHLAYSAANDPECVPVDADPDSISHTCGQPLRVQDFSLDIADDPTQPQLARLSEGSFGGAYLEMHLSNIAPMPSYYTHVWLWATGCSQQYHYEHFTLPASADYVRFEVPLSVMAGANGPLTYAVFDTQASGAPLCGFAIGPTWHKTSVGRLANVVIRY